MLNGCVNWQASVYQKSKPQEEIGRSGRDAFWSKQDVSSVFYVALYGGSFAYVCKQISCSEVTITVCLFVFFFCLLLFALFV